jgi:hypothetical protein
MAPASLPYIYRTRSYNELLNALLAPGKISFRERDVWTFLKPRPGEPEEHSANPVFVHFVRQILWEDKDRAAAAPGLRRAKRAI